MKTCNLFVSGFLVCVLLVSPLQTHAQVVTNEESYRAILLELIEALQKQILILQTQLELQLASETETETDKAQTSFSDSVLNVATYKIQNQTDVSRIKNKEHREYFERVFELFPDEYDAMIKRLKVFDGEDTAFDAFVETIPPAHDFWLYAVNKDIIKDQDSKPNAELIVHELAHLISYEEVLDLPKPSQSKCEDYFKVHGCPVENSYLQQFVNTFWSTSDLKRVEQSIDADDLLEEAYVHYKKHKDDYVTEYAASSPEEDFSESFVFFTLDEFVKKGTIAREKVDFFNQFSDLITVKEEILENQ